MFVPDVELHIRQVTTTTSLSTSASRSASTSPSSASTTSTSSASTVTSQSSQVTSSSTSSSSSSSSSSSITSSSSSSSASVSATQVPSTSGGSKSALIGGIVGGVIGGLLLLITLSILFTSWRRRKNNALKRPRGSVYFDPKKMSKEKHGEDVHSSLSHFLSPSSPQVTDHHNSTSAVPLLPVQGDHNHGSIRNSSSLTADPDTHDGQALRSPYSMDVGYRGHNPESSSYSLPMPSPYSEHGHGNETDDQESFMPTHVTAGFEGSDFRRMTLVRPDFSLAALEASLTGSPQSSRSPALPPSSVDMTPHSEIDGFASSKPATSLDELHLVAPSAGADATESSQSIRHT